ncbi:hypothetical protein AVHY2522_23205 [Acidovorax sp. SUPP2522]|uniref:hypothetical protein n=1 Tax=unclassified Acidovorax TaxID=2684926 RepID=UPI00234A5F3D|nr:MULTISPECIES: hypothetical protein [unclassified Acidovorax]WCM98908.1 hypothetical protein M5C96_05535 [Acidovorax sp. GBBC 1281]GKT19638.1 hypothetical protein AVHY2522_23205 [Acidovorax sp. SUPP2522]
MSNFSEIDSLQSWMSQTAERQEYICDEILERLPDRFQLAEPFRSIESKSQSKVDIPCFYDEEYETPLSLVFGGFFDYGMSDAHKKAIQALCSPDEWQMLKTLVEGRVSPEEKAVRPFLMSRFPLFEWVAEENIDLSGDLERPDFSTEEGPYPIYLSTSETEKFLRKSGYRLPWDHEWEYVAKELRSNIFIGGDKLPRGDLSKNVCLTSFGSASKNKKASNFFGIAGLGLAAMTKVEGRNGVMVRGGASGFYPFQGPAQWAMLSTELQIPLQNMPDSLAGIRLCMDIPS